MKTLPKQAKSVNPLHPSTSQPTGGETLLHGRDGDKWANADERPSHVSYSPPTTVPSGSWGASLCRDKSGPIGFITCPEPPTSKLSRSEQSAFSSWQRQSFRERKSLALNLYFDVCPGCTASCETCISSKDFRLGKPQHGYKVSLFPSGELSGGQFSRNVQSRPPSTNGSRLSIRFTPSARTKIRRSVENSPFNLNVFMTLTFAPSKVRPLYNCFSIHNYKNFKFGYWKTVENDCVPQTYAKKRLIRFLDTLSRRQRRTVESRGSGDQLQYIWTAELQQNGNIHFHILLNVRFPIKWLSARWDQASNSVDVKSLTNTEHAARYISKYVSKDENSIIDGRRYYITDGLRKAMKPTVIVYEGLEMKKEVQDILNVMKEEIEKEGGKVLDFGFHLPKPRRSRPYKDKDGKKKMTKSTSSRIQMPILRKLDELNTVLAVPF